jgi:hypothetical protein
MNSTIKTGEKIVKVFNKYIESTDTETQDLKNPSIKNGKAK